MARFMVLLAMTFAAVAQQQPNCTATIPAVDSKGVGGVMLSDLGRGMVYVVYSNTILPVSATDCSIGNSITLPHTSTFSISMSTLVTAIDPSTGMIGTADASTIQTINSLNRNDRDDRNAVSTRQQ
jgi:hypothetical protein